MASSSLIVALCLVSTISLTHAYLYNITVVLNEGGSDQKGQIDLLMQGEPPERSIVNLGDWETPIPAGKDKSYGADVTFIEAHQVQGLDLSFYDHAEEGKNSLLINRVIVDPEYLKDNTENRKKYTLSFCPETKDYPVVSWKFIDLKRC